MYPKTGTALLVALLALSGMAAAQTINEYTVLKSPGKVTVDGNLDEAGWKAAPATGNFVVYHDGAAPKQTTRARMLWDEKYLYISFLMNDRDVWAKTKSWKEGCLCSEEVAEVFIDPDGDGLNYLEIEVNPYKALMPLRMDKEYSKGGAGDFTWTCPGLLMGTRVNGTLNDSTDVDKNWICELAIPYSAVSSWSPDRSFPPRDGESWRINLYRYEYPRPAVKGGEELTAWNQTDNKRGFHAPDRFGKIIFSTKVAGKK